MAYYFDKSNWHFNITGPGIKVPFPIVLVGTALLGATFLMFMPAVGFGLCVYASYKKISGM